MKKMIEEKIEGKENNEKSILTVEELREKLVKGEQYSSEEKTEQEETQKLYKFLKSNPQKYYSEKFLSEKYPHASITTLTWGNKIQASPTIKGITYYRYPPFILRVFPYHPITCALIFIIGSLIIIGFAIYLIIGGW